LKHERATEEIRELAALYALGSLTQHEAHSFEIHMREGCSVCEAEFHRFEHIIAGMGFAVDEAAAPDYVRDLLLARIERENRPAIAAAAAQVKIPESKAKQIKPETLPSPPIVFSQPPQKQTSVLAWALTALFAIAALFMYFTLKSGQDANIQVQADYSAAKSDLDNLKALLDVQKARIGELDQIRFIADKPGTQVLRLSGEAPAPAAAGVILWDGAEGKFLAFGVLPPEPEGKVYQLWFLSPTAKIRAGSFKLKMNNQFFVSDLIPRDAANATVAGITLEPDNGSQFPTLPYYAVARIAN
jgi:anti-sigma-K factor RskA